MKLSRILSAVLCLSLVMGLSIPAFADNECYYFKEENTNTSYNLDELRNYNQKTIRTNAATITCEGTDALGWGYYLRLYNNVNSIKTASYWYNMTNNFRKPGFTSSANSNLQKYYIEGRIDNDYSGPYYIYGKFNADETSGK